MSDFKFLQVLYYVLMLMYAVCCYYSYEKMISGMYMGEVARQVIVKMADTDCMFKRGISARMRTPMMFYTKYISEIERCVNVLIDISYCIRW